MIKVFNKFSTLITKISELNTITWSINIVQRYLHHFYVKFSDIRELVILLTGPINISECMDLLNSLDIGVPTYSEITLINKTILNNCLFRKYAQIYTNASK